MICERCGKEIKGSRHVEIEIKQVVSDSRHVVYCDGLIYCRKCADKEFPNITDWWELFT